METAIIVAQFALKYGIPAAQELAALFTKPAPTQADWNAVWSKAEKTYDSYVAEDGELTAKTQRT